MTTQIYYKEHLIIIKCGYYLALGKFFKTIKQAKKAIDELF